MYKGGDAIETDSTANPPNAAVMTPGSGLGFRV